MKANKLYLLLTIMLLVPCVSMAQSTPVKDKVAVLITGWGMPAGYNFGYAWTSPDLAQVGDKTEYEGQPCKIGHVGEFPYQSHMNFIPWSILFKTAGNEQFYDYYGVYKLENGTYVSPNPDIPPVNPADIPEGIPVTPLKDVTESGVLKYPVDPRDGMDYVAGWYQIGTFQKPFPNGVHDFKESMPGIYTRYYGIMGVPKEAVDPNDQHPAVLAQDAFLKKLMDASFGDSIDMRFGAYSPISGYTRREDDVAEDFAKEGFTKMLIARETTDNNRYANEFFSGNYVKERLCELGKLDSTQIQQTRQVGRTPEFNAMNIRNLKPFIEAFPEGSTIGIIYVTRGLPWGKDETSGPFGTAHPWSKEIYHENAYLNYLSLKKALKTAFGSRYNLVFTRGGAESDLRADNFFSYAVNKTNENGGVFISVREAIQAMKQDGIDKIVIAPGHWNYDNIDTILTMKLNNGLPITPKADILANKFGCTHCEDADGKVVACDSPAKAAQITAASSFSNLPEEFATAYYVVLRGTLERFGLYPKDARISIAAQQPVTKLDGGTVAVTKFFSLINKAKIEIPPDPYPDRPESFTDKTAIPVNDPNDTNECMWEDTNIIIGQQLNPPAMKTARAVGPAVHFGPYRTFFNRDVTITIPYRRLLALGKTVKAYVYNHVTKDWDALETEKKVNGTITFKTKVLGLFQAGVE
ncbi:MAG: hypothetical protein NTV89_16020 [Proteobacteria bacterium]|nr:hypothetical protein [Pseudomonadota bacterium]